MHALPFAFKHAHLASLKLLRKFTASEELTPARFDLLYALHVSRGRRPYQWRLAQTLGVSRATICKMVKGLCRLGFLEISATKTRRQRRITVTRYGRKRFARVLKAVRRRKVEAAIRYAWRAMEESRFEQWATVAELLEATRRYVRGLGEFRELYRYLSLFRGTIAFAFGASCRW